ncbi:hypothetical protein [Mycobacterium servetii]|uniref:Uncharacterized protein n=1 Tax=Mycobacterium servetii TaxID=3237418 RepID=A0ABV4BUH0_9MYCO
MTRSERSVWAVDVLSAVVSFSRITDADPQPRIGRVLVRPEGKDHTPLSQWQRASAAADEVMHKLTGNGKPALVVMAKQQWGSSGAGGKGTSDPTAARRLALHALIEDRLHKQGVPVAEFPYPTCLVWLCGHQHKGSTMSSLAKAVQDTFGVTAPRETLADGTDRAVAFRPQVGALAAVGAMAAGIRTAVPVTDERLKIVRGEGNLAVQLPAGLYIPASAEEWERRASRHVSV